uniref:HisA/HisF-related TIM barrel protein n=1 Tax=Pararhizobium sp. IMCC3301 TaxID=3067904 RepID=UPI002740E89F|nr:HisA/HisF-related TIM barrel protein [Pararhizobium sp. IMCC3301]
MAASGVSESKIPQLGPTPGRPAPGRRVRVIPTLLIDRDGRLVKTVKFGKRTYIGDPINAVRIFNTKQVDELVLIDIDASAEGRPPAYDLIADIASEAFMPVAYGGGLQTEDQLARAFDCGVEKVILSGALAQGTGMIEAGARRWGGQSISVCLPVARNWLGREQVRLKRGRKALKSDLNAIVRQITEAGAGEIIVYSIDRDGTWEGYDTALLRKVADATTLPVVACGGAGSAADFRPAILEAGCAAVAAGSLFVFQRKGRGVLISYPQQDKLMAELFVHLN